MGAAEGEPGSLPAHQQGPRGQTSTWTAESRIGSMGGPMGSQVSAQCEEGQGETEGPGQ